MENLLVWIRKICKHEQELTLQTKKIRLTSLCENFLQKGSVDKWNEILHDECDFHDDI